MQRFRNKYLSSKAAILFMINRKMKDITVEGGSFGKLTDLEVLRQDKTILIELTEGKEASLIEIRRYGFLHRKGEPFLVWQDLHFDGPAKERYQKIFKKLDGIQLSKRNFSLVEAIL